MSEQQPLSTHSLYFPILILQYNLYIYQLQQLNMYAQRRPHPKATPAVAIRQQSSTLRRRIRWSSKSRSISRRYHRQTDTSGTVNNKCRRHFRYNNFDNVNTSEHLFVQLIVQQDVCVQRVRNM